MMQRHLQKALKQITTALCLAKLVWYGWLVGGLFLTITGSVWAQSVPQSALPAWQTSPWLLNGQWQFLDGNLRPMHPSAVDQLSGWQAMTVPANWHTQGTDHHGWAWYKRSFELSAEEAQRSAFLQFDGVDYTADVWLNGHYLGHHEGYFQSFGFDVSAALQAGRNTLHVLVNSPLETPQAWSLRKRLIKGIFSHHDTRPGGAWSVRGQEQNTGGIWSDVRLVWHQGVRVSDLRVTPTPILGADAKIGTAWRLAVDGQLHWTRPPQTASKDKGTRDVQAPIQPRIDRASVRVVPHNFEGPAVLDTTWSWRGQAHQGDTVQWQGEIPQPVQAWWPAGRGAQALYKLELRLWQGQRVVAQSEAVFGFRSFQVHPHTQAWTINGQRLFIKGTNYIPTQWLSEMSRADYERDVRLMLQAHVNTVRVHAHVGAREFYRVCDELGLLVMQDFPLQWGYEDSPTFLAQAQRQLRDMQTQWHNHPSVVVWSLHNEPPWDADWMKWKYPDYQPQQNKILDQVLWHQARKADPTREVRLHSATAEHPWLGWYSGHQRDYAKPTQQAWITEFGAQALPVLSSLQKIFTAEELWPQNDAVWEKWAYHNFQQRETFEIAKVPKGNNIQEFIANTQTYQAELTKLAAESYRRQRYQPVTAAFQFMFVENWPSVNWGILDYWRIPKPGYYALQAAFAPVLVHAHWEQEPRAGQPWAFGLHVTNDTWQAYSGVRYHMVLSDKTQQTVWEHTALVDVTPDSGQEVHQAQTVLKGDNGPYQLRLQLQQAGRTIAENNYTLRLP
ncbi:MAG: glycoside hydrolase family 2 sugar binding protein [Pseudomonadota bacterium]|jgi:beta-mannosidase